MLRTHLPELGPDMTGMVSISLTHSVAAAALLGSPTWATVWPLEGRSSWLVMASLVGAMTLTP